jgi:hypothetical protein
MLSIFVPSTLTDENRVALLTDIKAKLVVIAETIVPDFYDDSHEDDSYSINMKVRNIHLPLPYSLACGRAATPAQKIDALMFYPMSIIDALSVLDSFQAQFKKNADHLTNQRYFAEDWMNIPLRDAIKKNADMYPALKRTFAELKIVVENYFNSLGTDLDLYDVAQTPKNEVPTLATLAKIKLQEKICNTHRQLLKKTRWHEPAAEVTTRTSLFL